MYDFKCRCIHSYLSFYFDWITCELTSSYGFGYVIGCVIGYIPLEPIAEIGWYCPWPFIIHDYSLWIIYLISPERFIQVMVSVVAHRVGGFSFHVDLLALSFYCPFSHIFFCSFLFGFMQHISCSFSSTSRRERNFSILVCILLSNFQGSYTLGWSLFFNKSYLLI